MYNRKEIISWISGFPESTATDTPENTSRKRKLPDPDQKLASPPTSLEICDFVRMPPTPRKRRMVNCEGDDASVKIDATPRPEGRSPSKSSFSLSGASSFAASRSSSPKKQMMSLRLSNSGVEIKPLDSETSPDVARDLVNTMEEIGRAHDILPHALESTIIEHVKSRNMDPYRWRHSFRLPGEADELPGRVPTFEEVEKIHRKASECQEFNHEEASWNSQVHLRLLESIFEEVLGGQCDSFNAMSW